MESTKSWLGHGKGKRHQVRQKINTTRGNPRVDGKNKNVNSSSEVPDTSQEEDGQ